MLENINNYNYKSYKNNIGHSENKFKKKNLFLVITLKEK